MDGHLVLPPRPAPTQTRRRHAAETLRLAGPLAVAQLAGMAMGVTDTLMLGSLGGDALAAGGLGMMLFISATVLLQGMLTSVSVVVAQARGAGQDGLVPAAYWTGLAMALLLSVPAWVVFSFTEPVLLAAGQPPGLAHDAGRYMDVVRWAMPGDMVAIGLMRAFLPAIGQGATMLWVSLAATLANALLCWALIHGIALRSGVVLPALGLPGAAWATVLVLTGMAAVLLALVHGRPSLRRFVGWRRPGAALVRRMAALGLPVTGSFAVETGMFLGIGLLIGRLGPGPLAAHQVALNVVSVSFMVPLALAQAANVRVGHRVGAGDLAGARRAGLVAVGLAAGVEALGAVVLLLAPGTLAGWYIDPALPANAEAFGITVGLLGIAAAFQVADGVQVAAGGALRGLGDTSVPFMLSTACYWGLGIPAAWWLTQDGAGAAGAWWGLAAGLLAAAVLLTGRFVRHSRV